MAVQLYLQTRKTIANILYIYYFFLTSLSLLTGRIWFILELIYTIDFHIDHKDKQPCLNQLGVCRITRRITH